MATTWCATCQVWRAAVHSLWLAPCVAAVWRWRSSPSTSSTRTLVPPLILTLTNPIKYLHYKLHYPLSTTTVPLPLKSTQDRGHGRHAAAERDALHLDVRSPCSQPQAVWLVLYSSRMIWPHAQLTTVGVRAGLARDSVHGIV